MGRSTRTDAELPKSGNGKTPRRVRLHLGGGGGTRGGRCPFGSPRRKQVRAFSAFYLLQLLLTQLEIRRKLLFLDKI